MKVGIKAYSVFIILILSSFFLLKNLNSPNLWYDEAGQFWMAKGLHHHSDPFAKDMGLKSMISINRGYNLDPGGFNILLRFWLSFSSHHVWLRILPFIFCLLTYLLFTFLIKKWISSTSIAIGLPSLLFLSPLITHYSFEIRPYSFTFFSVVLIFLILLRLSNSNKRYEFLLSGTILSFLIWGRYNILIQVTAALLILSIKQFAKYHNFKEVIHRFFWLGTPLIISFALMVLFELRFQWGSGTRYLPEFLIRNNISLLFQWSFIKSIIPLIVYCSIYALLIRGFWIYINDSHKLLFLYLVTLNIIYIATSALGLYPYHPATRWNIDIVVITILGIISLICIVYNLFSLRYKITNPVLTIIIFGILIINTINFSNRKNLPEGEYGYQYNQFEHSAELFQKFSENKLVINKISFLESKYIPNIRYLFEYGDLKDSPYLAIYPKIDFLYESWPQVNFIVDFNQITSDCLIISQNSMVIYRNLTADWKMFKSNGFLCYYKIPEYKRSLTSNAW